MAVVKSATMVVGGAWGPGVQRLGRELLGRVLVVASLLAPLCSQVSVDDWVKTARLDPKAAADNLVSEGPAALWIAKSIMRERRWDVVVPAVEACGRMGSLAVQECRALLITCLDHAGKEGLDGTALGIACARALAKLGHADAKILEILLETATEHPSPQVRRACGAACAELQPGVVDVVLTRAARDPGVGPRRWIDALLGVSGGSLLPAVQRWYGAESGAGVEGAPDLLCAMGWRILGALDRHGAGASRLAPGVLDSALVRMVPFARAGVVPWPNARAAGVVARPFDLAIVRREFGRNGHDLYLIKSGEAGSKVVVYQWQAESAIPPPIGGLALVMGGEMGQSLASLLGHVVDAARSRDIVAAIHESETRRWSSGEIPHMAASHPYRLRCDVEMYFEEDSVASAFHGVCGVRNWPSRWWMEMLCRSMDDLRASEVWEESTPDLEDVVWMRDLASRSTGAGVRAALEALVARCDGPVPGGAMRGK